MWIFKRPAEFHARVRDVGLEDIDDPRGTPCKILGPHFVTIILSPWDDLDEMVEKRYKELAA